MPDVFLFLCSSWLNFTSFTCTFKGTVISVVNLLLILAFFSIFCLKIQRLHDFGCKYVINFGILFNFGCMLVEWLRHMWKQHSPTYKTHRVVFNVEVILEKGVTAIKFIVTFIVHWQLSQLLASEHTFISIEIFITWFKANYQSICIFGLYTIDQGNLNLVLGIRSLVWNTNQCKTAFWLFQ